MAKKSRSLHLKIIQSAVLVCILSSVGLAALRITSGNRPESKVLGLWDTFVSASGFGQRLCTQQYQPVCGTNGQTYSNSCYAASAGVQIACQSACPCTGYATPAPTPSPTPTSSLKPSPTPQTGVSSIDFTAPKIHFSADSMVLQWAPLGVNVSFANEGASIGLPPLGVQPNGGKNFTLHFVRQYADYKVDAFFIVTENKYINDKAVTIENPNKRQMTGPFFDFSGSRIDGLMASIGATQFKPGDTLRYRIGTDDLRKKPPLFDSWSYPPLAYPVGVEQVLGNMTNTQTEYRSWSYVRNGVQTAFMEGLYGPPYSKVFEALYNKGRVGVALQNVKFTLY